MKSALLACGHVLILAATGMSCEQAKAPIGNAYVTINPTFTGRMIMGDTGDLRMEAGEEGSDRFVYSPEGKGPHEWEYKFVNGEENKDPSRFAGVMYINSLITSEPGTQSGDGQDLRDWRQGISWEARSIGADVNVEFVAGGINWAWDPTTKRKVRLPQPDSLRALSLGACKLKSAWTRFDFDLGKVGLSAESFKHVIGGFGFVIKAPGSRRTVTIEIRDVRYVGQGPPTEKKAAATLRGVPSIPIAPTSIGRMITGDVGDLNPQAGGRR